MGENDKISFDGNVCAYLNDEFFAPVRIIDVFGDMEEEVYNFVNSFKDMKFKIILEKVQ